MSKLTGAEFLAKTLKGYDVSHFFFMPVIVPESIPEMEKLNIKRIMTHSEKGAAYMADAFGRISKKPGICGSQSVGALNLSAGLQDAYLGCSPVIALTGRLPQSKQFRNAYQEVDHMKPFDAVTKFNTLVNSVTELPTFLRQAFREATSGTPGPVHLDLCGIAGGEIMTGVLDSEIVVEKEFTKTPAFRPQPESQLVLKALDSLKNSQRPIIIAGGGVRSSSAGEELTKVAEFLQIPVATSLNAKQTMPYNHPLNVGVCGSYSRSCSNKAVSMADLVFFIGSHSGGQVTNDWEIPRPGTRAIQIDINPDELGRSYPLEVGIQGDVKATLTKMIKILQSENVKQKPNKWTSTIEHLVSDWKDSVFEIENSSEIPIRPERLCKDLTNLLPNDSILVSDTGHAGIWTGTIMDLKYSTQDYIRCAGSLGWGIPAAIGAKCAAPDRTVVCFTGDGGAWYHLTELDTALRYGIKTITVVNNNASLNQEQALNEHNYGGRTPGSDELWMLSDCDFASVANAMGCFGITVEKPSEISNAFQMAVESKLPVVIDVKTDIAGIAPKAWN